MSIQITDTFSAALKAAQGGFEKVMDEATEKNAFLLQANVVKGLRHQTRDHIELKGETLKYKKGSQILVEEGDLSGSVEVEKVKNGVYEVGTNRPDALAHEFGFEKRNLPARPYFAPAIEESQDEMVENWNNGIKRLFKK